MFYMIVSGASLWFIDQSMGNLTWYSGCIPVDYIFTTQMGKYFSLFQLFKEIKYTTKHQIEGAEKARTLYMSLGFPSECNFEWILQSNQIMNCPVSIQDVEVAYKI